MPLESSELISELNFEDGSNLSADIWIGGVGTYDLAIGYSLIFWPQFVVIDDYVFRHCATKDLFDHWWTASKGNALAVQKMINHLHLVDIHMNDTRESQVRYLGRILKQIYEAKLKIEFPDRNFIVVFNDEPGVDLLHYVLTFWQVEKTITK